MDNFNGTKGNWEIKKINGRFLKVESNGIIISELESIMLPMYPTPEGMEANAKLIAAAPELLSACEFALNEIKYRGLQNDGKGIMNCLNNAINKALK